MNKYFMDAYDYELNRLRQLTEEELIELIESMIDYDETTKACVVLSDINPQKMIELGRDILINDKGDDYLQATIWNIIFIESQKDAIVSIMKRKSMMQKTLLDDVIHDLTAFEDSINKDLYELINKSYMNLSEDDISSLCWNEYQDFVKKFGQL